MQKEVRFLEALIRIKGEQATTRFHQDGKQGPAIPLLPGTPIEISPSPGLWIRGTYERYKQDPEHLFVYDQQHFVGLIDGMIVRLPLATIER